MRQLKLILASVFLISPLAANAVPITLDFTVSGFGVSNGNAAPTDPVSGTIVYDAAGLGATINSLTSISLTLNGYVYSLSEIDFQSPFGGNTDIIYGSLSGTGISNLTNDFWIRFDRVAATGFDFAYASASLSGIWTSMSFTSFSLRAATVPEPGTLSLLGVGLLGFAMLRRRRRTA